MICTFCLFRCSAKCLTKCIEFFWWLEAFFTAKFEAIELESNSLRWISIQFPWHIIWLKFRQLINSSISSWENTSYCIKFRCEIQSQSTCSFFVCWKRWNINVGGLISRAFIINRHNHTNRNSKLDNNRIFHLTFMNVKNPLKMSMFNVF